MPKPYVYVVKDGETPLYVGKGSGRRMHISARAHGGKAEVIEECVNDTHAFKRERYWIKELQPQNNKMAGGNGCRVKSRKPRIDAMTAEINRIGTQRFTAQGLLRKLDESNCEAYGLSKLDLDRLREVAHG